MRTKLTALALAVLIATGGSGVVAASVASSDTGVQSDEPTDPAATLQVDEYELVPVDEDGWFDETAAADPATVAELLLDGEAGEEIREQFDANETLTIEVHGGLQRAADSAHVRVFPASSTAGANDTVEGAVPRPLVEATVDVDSGTADVVGVDTDRPEPDERFDAAASIEFDVAAANESAADPSVTRLTTGDTGTILSAEQSFETGSEETAAAADAGAFEVGVERSSDRTQRVAFGDERAVAGGPADALTLDVVTPAGSDSVGQFGLELTAGPATETGDA